MPNKAGDDNGGQLYRMSTGPTLGIPAGQTAYGQVLGADGVTPVAGAVVHLVLRACPFDKLRTSPEPCRRDGAVEGSAGQSAPLSAVTDDQGYWSVNLGAARTQEGDSYFITGSVGRLGVAVWHPALEHATWSVQLRDWPAVLPLELRVTWSAYPRSR